MKIEKFKWVDSCEFCGAVYNAQKLFINQDKYEERGDGEEYYEEFGFLPWKCPSCKEFNNLKN